jgi:chemotaxis protein CheY-P-specific phosphatase CheC
MTPDGALTGVVAAGVENCAARLGEITHVPWRVLSVALSHDDEGPFTDAHSSVVGDHYGSHFSFKGGRFLVLFSGKTGYLVTTAFTRDFKDHLENMPKRESSALGEVSNVMLNPLIGHLAKQWGRRLMISTPETRIASPRDHLTRALSHYGEADRLAATFFAHLESPGLFSECRIMLFLDRVLLDGLPGSAL